jgi:hypothetical protein
MLFQNKPALNLSNENCSTITEILAILNLMLATETEAAILKRVIHPEWGNLSPEAARQLLQLGFDESDHAHMAELSSKAQTASLTPSEQDELDGYINVSHLIAFLHSRARMSLKPSLPGSSNS